MLPDSYVKQEKRYLNEESQKFVEQFPQISQFLSEPYFDPDINRTLDGFTYLSGLLHAKLHQEYPQLTTNLMNMLWPNYLQQTPSMTVIELTNHDVKCQLIASSASVLSAPSSESEMGCSFRITRDIWASPFTIQHISQPSAQTIELKFSAERMLNLAESGIDRLRLFLGADALSSFPLYLYFSEYLCATSLVVNQQVFTLPDLKAVPNGFDTQDAILDYPANTFAGYRLLHEYFSFTEGFLFFDLQGFPDYLDRLNSDSFSLKFEFKHRLPSTLKLTEDSIKINCTPVINLFYHDCEPICLSGDKTQYPLYISHKHRHYYELFAIEEVTGWAKNRTRKYTNFDSFLHQTDFEKGKTPLYYHLNRHLASDSTKEQENIRYSLAFIRGDEATLHNIDEVISVRALCSNREEAQRLRIGDICLPGENIPSLVSLKNITFPSGVTRPNLDGSLQWSALSSLSLNYLSLLNKDSLCQILQNYNFTTRYSQREEKSLTKLLNCIHSLESVPYQQYYQQLIVEGHKSTLVISPEAFHSPGEMYLFGAVLAHFYSQYAAVNSFHFLELVNSSTHEVYQWSLMNA